MSIRTSGTGIIREVVELDSIDSTNTYALGAGREGLLVSASTQTSGRGRQGRTWVSSSGRNIAMTLLLKKVDPRLSIVAGVAVREALSRLVPAIEIKWPNDLIAEGRKLCGILCESRGGMTAVGIGINVNQRDWPPDLEGRAVSLAVLLGSEQDRGQVLELVTASLEKWLETFFSQGFEPVREEFMRHGLLRGHNLATEEGLPCTIVEIDAEGRLVLDVSGTRRELVSGTILVRS